MKLSHTDKPSKAAAYDIIVNMKKGECLPTKTQIDSLINYFAPAIPAKAKTAEQWVAKAAAVKEVRNYLNYMHASAGILYASDGHRLHWAPTDKPNGFYDPKTGATVSIDQDYPQVERIIQGTWSVPQEFNIDECEVGQILKGGKPISYRLIGKVPVNNRYLYDALNGARTVKLMEGKQAIRGESEFGNFVVMKMALS